LDEKGIQTTLLDSLITNHVLANCSPLVCCAMNYYTTDPQAVGAGVPHRGFSKATEWMMDIKSAASLSCNYYYFHGNGSYTRLIMRIRCGIVLTLGRVDGDN